MYRFKDHGWPMPRRLHIEFNSPLVQRVEGIHSRTDYDLARHEELSP